MMSFDDGGSVFFDKCINPTRLFFPGSDGHCACASQGTSVVRLTSVWISGLVTNLLFSGTYNKIKKIQYARPR